MTTTQEKYNIVCLAWPAWEGDYLKSTVELMKCMSKGNKVLYVDYAYTFSDVLKGIAGKKKIDWKRVVGLKKRCTKVDNVDGEMYLLSLPPIFPSLLFNSYKLYHLSNKINAFFTGLAIKKYMRRLQMDNSILIYAQQVFLGLYWKLPARLKVFYCYDEFSNVAYYKGFVRPDELLFTPKADVLVVTSAELKKRKQLNNIPTYVIPNGVYFSNFYKALNPKKNNTPKVVGYVGSIDNRLDADMLESVIAALPEILFRFIGKIFDQAVFSRLSKHSNTQFVPPVQSDKIPELMSQLDIGIIPYVCNNLTAAIYPLKINEYLALGLPVIITPFAPMEEAENVIHTVTNTAEFITAIKKSLTETGECQVQQRIKVAKTADWHTRAADFLTVLKPHLPPHD